MIFIFLITIVFIAEIIIFCAMINGLLHWDKSITETNSIITKINPDIKEVAEIARKISEQYAELAPFWAENIKSLFFKISLNNFKGILTGLLLILIKRKFKIRKIYGIRLLKFIRLLNFN